MTLDDYHPVEKDPSSSRADQILLSYESNDGLWQFDCLTDGLEFRQQGGPNDAETFRDRLFSVWTSLFIDSPIDDLLSVQMSYTYRWPNPQPNSPSWAQLFPGRKNGLEVERRILFAPLPSQPGWAEKWLEAIITHPNPRTFYPEDFDFLLRQLQLQALEACQEDVPVLEIPEFLT